MRIATLVIFGMVMPASPIVAQDGTGQPPRLISFDGIHELAAEAGRHRMLTQKLSYTLKVDTNGKPTDCEYSRRFRRKAVRLALCRPLLKHMTFEPARNSEGDAVPGIFRGTIDFDMWMGTDGYLDQEDRN